MPATTPRPFDVVIIGTGSGNTILTPDFDSLRVAIVEKGVFGGTCINRGCVPTKMFVYAADIASHVTHAATYGIDATIDKVRWGDIVDRVFTRIDPIAPNGKAYRESAPNTTVYTAEARFVSPKVIQVTAADGTTELITGEHIVLAAGARPLVPDVAGLDSVDYHTSDTIMRLTELPERLIIFGGGYIAAEMAHVFGSLGSEVIMVNRSRRLLAREDEAVSHRFTDLSQRRFDCHLSTRVDSVSQDASGITVRVHNESRQHYEITGDALLVAVGRVPNGDTLDLGAGGVEVDANGYVIPDEYLRTTARGVWALGDVTNDNQLKHVANAEARAVAHNLIHPESLRTADLWPIPHAVFADPQVASVGQTEQELRHRGRHYVTAVQNYSDVAYGWAMEDTGHFCKIIACPDSRQILGAHIIGPQASILIQQLIQGMKFGQTVDQLAHGQIYIHPALTEVVENALLKF
jgi:mycothione reductase